MKLRNSAPIKLKIMHGLPHTRVFTFCTTVPAQKLQIQRLSGRKLILCREIMCYYKKITNATQVTALIFQNMKAFYNIIPSV